MDGLRIEDLYQIKGEILRSSTLNAQDQKTRITIHMGTCGISSGADKVARAFEALQTASE